MCTGSEYVNIVVQNHPRTSISYDTWLFPVLIFSLQHIIILNLLFHTSLTLGPLSFCPCPMVPHFLSLLLLQWEGAKQQNVAAATPVFNKNSVFQGTKMACIGVYDGGCAANTSGVFQKAQPYSDQTD